MSQEQSSDHGPVNRYRSLVNNWTTTASMLPVIQGYPNDQDSRDLTIGARRRGRNHIVPVLATTVLEWDFLEPLEVIQPRNDSVTL